MSYFGITLKELLQEKDLRPVDIHRISGVSQPQISRLISGEQTWVSAKDLESICLAISKEPRDHARLVRSYLQDQYAGSGHELIQIQIKGDTATTLKEDTAHYGRKIPASLRKKLEQVGLAAVEDQDVMLLLDSIVNLRTKGKL